jgi:hypothetical protein
MEAETICGRCGKIHKTWHGHPSCSAHKKRTDPLEPCPNPPRNGLTVCRIHGGNTPVALAKADEKLALMQANGEIAQLMREVDLPDQHPIDGLLEVVRVSGAMMRLLTIKVGELGETPETREIVVEEGKGGLKMRRVDDGEAFWGLNKDSEMVPHIYVQLLKTWTERYERACATALAAGIEERRIRLAEDTADTFFTALSKATAAAELTPKQMEALMQALAKQLRTEPKVLEARVVEPDDEDLI